MDIISPRLLMAKGALFGGLSLLSASLLLAPIFSVERLALLLIVIWASCRTYYFCFYVMHHYVDPRFRYAGLLSLLQYLRRR